MSRYVLSAATLLAVMAGLRSMQLQAEQQPTKEAEKKTQPSEPQKPKPLITVSKETTHLTGPLDDGGYVDYLAALNAQESKGLTRETNAGVYFVRALGLEGSPEFRARYFKLLGIDPLPEQGDYLTDFHAYVQNSKGRQPNKQEEFQYDTALHGPWSKEDFPLVADWLQSNEKPLKLIVQGTQQKKCYFPLVKPGDSDTMIAVLLPTVQQARGGARVLLARAMLRLDEGNIKEAQQDLLTVHRLGRLVGNTPFLIAGLVGIAIEAMAFQCETRLLEHGKLSSHDALAYQAELRKLPPMPVMAEQIDQFERLSVLDVVTSMARRGPSILKELGGNSEASGIAAAVQSLFVNSLLINWDEVLKFENQQFDKLAAAAKKPTAHERAREFHNLEQELKVFKAEVTDPATLAGSFLQGNSPRKTMGRQMGKVLAALMIPAVSQAAEAENRTRTRELLMQLGCALTAYCADHGKFPETLDRLVPKYIARVPSDLYTEQPLKYVSQTDFQSILLYSVGKNEIDNAGQSFDAKPPGDDINLELVHRREQK